MRAHWPLRLSVLFALIGSLAFTPVRVSITVDVSFVGAATDAAKAISTEILDRGGELVTSPSGARWYVLMGISVSLSASGHLVVIEASRMRGAGCSSKSLRRDEDEVFAVLDQFIADVARKSGIPMSATRRKEANQSSEPMPAAGTSAPTEERKVAAGATSPRLTSFLRGRF